MMLALLVALRAMRHAVRIAFFLDVLKAGFIVREAAQKILYGEAQVLGNALFGFHNANSMA